jgi:hypothetical protein
MNEAQDDYIFPIYRKYKHGKNYFKINSRTQFEEIQCIGTVKVHHVIDAKQFPELNFILDLIKINFKEIEQSNEIEYKKNKPKW